jgi:hypothetical protein
MPSEPFTKETSSTPWLRSASRVESIEEPTISRSEVSANTRNQILRKYLSGVWSPSKFDGANMAYQAPGAIVDGILRGDTNRIRSVVSSITRELAASIDVD